MTTRVDLQVLSDLRLKEAEVLHAGGLFSGAYYIVGYAAELGLKACIARLFKADAIPETKLVERARSHILQELVIFAELKPHLDRQIAADRIFALNWEVVRGWHPDDRYRITADAVADELLTALRDTNHGVLTWIRIHW